MSQPKYYEPLYRFISSGGEGLVLTCRGRALSFRTPTASDYQGCLRYSASLSEQETFLLACCLTRVGGFKVSEKDRYKLYNHLKSLPRLKKRAMPHFWKVVEETQKSAEMFEAFCYSENSRYLWGKWKSSSKFGFPLEGNELTDIHLQWIAFNELEDKKEDLEDAWRRAFFQASAMNPKGVEKIQKEWDKKRGQEKRHREKVLKLAEKGETSTRDQSGEKTIQDLQTEYRNWVDGVEDGHDKIVREYKENLTRFISNGRKVVSRQKSDSEDMASSFDELNSLSMNTPLKAYSDDEIEKMVASGNRNTVTFDESGDYDEIISNKYLTARELIRDKSSLMDQVAKRKLPTIEG
jgi:hypothetical protein